MSNTVEDNGYEIQSIIDQTPFEIPAVQAFFARWCEINDSIEPKVVDRTEWELQVAKNQILESQEDGVKKTLYIPKDLKLWEMVGVMAAVDQDTFITTPERQNQKRNEIIALGHTFQNAGVYIAQRLDTISSGKKIATALAEQFYDYGQALATGKRSKNFSTALDISKTTLTKDQTEEIDRFLAGDSLYKSRRARAESTAQYDADQPADFYEAERRRTLDQFFRVSEKAFELQAKSLSGGLRASPTQPAPWRDPASTHEAFLKRVQREVTQQIETPRRELTSSIFRRGMELLQENMPFDSLPDWVKNAVLHWSDGESTLREALQIDKMRAELEKLRAESNLATISAKEREIADNIQMAVSKFSYVEDANNPSEILATQTLNCVGASILGGALMKEAGLNYLVGDVPEHSILILITSDGHVAIRDMLSNNTNIDLEDNVFSGTGEVDLPLCVMDIVEFSKHPSPVGLRLDLKDTYFWWVKEGGSSYLGVFEPEYGQKIQVLCNTGHALSALGRKEEAIEAYRQAIEVDPKYSYPYYGLGNGLSALGRKEEAVLAYKDFIRLADVENDAYWIAEAKRMITALGI